MSRAEAAAGHVRAAWQSTTQRMSSPRSDNTGSPGVRCCPGRIRMSLTMPACGALSHCSSRRVWANWRSARSVVNDERAAWSAGSRRNLIICRSNSRFNRSSSAARSARYNVTSTPPAATRWPGWTSTVATVLAVGAVTRVRPSTRTTAGPVAYSVRVPNVPYAAPAAITTSSSQYAAGIHSGEIRRTSPPPWWPSWW